MNYLLEEFQSTGLGSQVEGCSNSSTQREALEITRKKE